MQKIKSAALALPALLLAGCAAALPAENTATIETAAAAAPQTLKVYTSASLAPAAQAYAEAQGVALTLTDEAASADLLLTDHAPGGSLLDVTSDTLLAAAAARVGITENANALPLGRSLYGYWARADVLNALLGDGAAAALQTANWEEWSDFVETLSAWMAEPKAATVTLSGTDYTLPDARPGSLTATGVFAAPLDRASGYTAALLAADGTYTADALTGPLNGVYSAVTLEWDNMAADGGEGIFRRAKLTDLLAEYGADTCNGLVLVPFKCQLDDSDLTAEDYNAEGLLNYPVLADVGSIAINAGTSADGLLTKKDYAAINWGGDAAHVDYGTLYEKRFAVLRKAYANFLKKRPVPGYETPYPDDWYRFRFLSSDWLPDYCLYMAIKEANGMVDWQQWPRALRVREPEALAEFKAEHAGEIEFWAFLQYEFDRQWRALHAYAKEKGVAIMGDIPIYVAADSADAWAGRELFETDAEGKPRRVAGCPPDYFAADGQLWGNPLYDWDYHCRTGYAWWILRIRHALSIYDILRIDHFRGFDTYWAIPAGETTARNGRWEQGPRMELFRALHNALGSLPIVAEDLGEMFDSVRELLAESGFPGMKVLQFAFTGEDSVDLPHNYPRNCVAYPGTHDNNTLTGWFAEELTAAQRKQVVDYFALTKQEGTVRGMLRGVLASTAALAIIPMADWLEETAAARMNTPGQAQGNWQWRADAKKLTPALAAEIRVLTERYFRAAK